MRFCHRSIRHPFLPHCLCRKISTKVILSYGVFMIRISSLHLIFLANNTFDVCFLHGPARAWASGPPGYPWTWDSNTLVSQLTSNPWASMDLRPSPDWGPRFLLLSYTLCISANSFSSLIILEPIGFLDLKPEFDLGSTSNNIHLLSSLYTSFQQKICPCSPL